MPLPEPERFTIGDVSKRWRVSRAYVNELLRRKQVTHLVVIGEKLGGSPLTRHVYFDETTYRNHYADEVEFDPVARRNEFEEAVKHYQREWKRRFGNGVKFDSTALKRQFDKERCITSVNIGRNEVANLWTSDREEWKRPAEGVQVFIPLSALRAFEHKHRVKPTQDREPLMSASQIDPDKLYSPQFVATFHGLSLSYIRNNMEKFGGEKIRARWKFRGSALLHYRKTQPKA
jgi:hypothetical protein